jgi:ArsR family transcriptional regulator, virulence genes transcriptional regulator
MSDTDMSDADSRATDVDDAEDVDGVSLDSAGASPPISQHMLDSVEKAAELLRSIGSAHRLMILCLLSERDMTVTEVCEATGMRQSLASQHLSRLRLDGLVKAERHGHFVTYRLSNPVARDVVALLHRHFCANVGAAPTDTHLP